MNAKLSLLLLSAVAQGKVVELTGSNFDETISQNTNVMVKFMAPWCGFCQKLSPLYEEASELFAKKSRVTLAKVDLTNEESTHLAEQYGITSIPTMVWFGSEGKPTRFEGRDKDELVNFVNKQLRSERCELSSEEQCGDRRDCMWREGECRKNYFGEVAGHWEYYVPGCNFAFFFSFLALLTTAYLLVSHIFSHKSMPRFLHENPSLMAYTMVSGAVITVLFGIGCVAMSNHWMNSSFFDTALKRLTYMTWEGDAVAQIHASYQLWNLILAISQRETIVTLVHHLFCTLLGLLNCGGFGYYHLIYMGGAAELSTIVLTAMDVFKNNKYLQQRYPKANAYTRYTFCGLFLILRVFVWFAVLYSFMSDIYVYLVSDHVGKKRLHCYMNILAMAILSAIQLVWAKLVVIGILKAMGILKSNKKHSTAAETTPANVDSIDTSDNISVASTTEMTEMETKKGK